MPSTKSVRLDPVQSFKVEKPSTVVRSLSSQSSSDGCICRISWFSVGAIRCHRCLPSCREEQACDCPHGGRCTLCIPPTVHDVAAEIGSSGQNFTTIKVRLAARCNDDGSHHSASFTVAAVEFEEDRRLMGGRDGGFPRDQRYCFRCAHASTREVVVFCVCKGV